MPEPRHSGRRRPDRDALAAEARRIGDDSVDRAEMQAVREDMDAIAADWPDGDAEPPREE